jgi:hypothetical protein
VKYHVWQACLPLAQQVAWLAQKALLLGQSLLVVLSNADLWRTESPRHRAPAAVKICVAGERTSHQTATA